MSKTKINWADETANPFVGCTKIASGCENCYAIQMAYRLQSMGIKGYENVVYKTPQGKLNWTGQINFIPERLENVAKSKTPKRIFVNSMSDLFHEKITNEQIKKIMSVIYENSQHTFLVLTKRAERINDFNAHYPPNLWLGFSASTQKDYNNSIDYLMQSEAQVKWVSIEPQLESIDIASYIGYIASQQTKGNEDGNYNQQRGDNLPSGDCERNRNTQRWDNLENSKTRIRPVEQENKIEQMQKSKSGKTIVGRLLNDTGNVQPEEIPHASAPISLQTFQGENPERNNDKSYKRDKERQQTREFGIGNIPPASNTFNVCFGEQSKISEPIGGEKLSMQINRQTSPGNNRKEKDGDEVKRNSDTIQNKFSTSIKNNIGGIKKNNFWIVVGSESGCNRRPFENKWAVDLVDQCKLLDIPIWIKQIRDEKNNVIEDINLFPKKLQIRQLPDNR